MLGEVGTVDRDDQPVKPGCYQRTDITRQEPAIGNDGARYAGSRDLRNEPDDLGMYQRLTALKRHVPDPAPVQDRQRPGKLGSIDVSCGAGQCLISGEAAKVAGSVANICDGNITDRGQLKI
jgi:hypothetical protein